MQESFQGGATVHWPLSQIKGKQLKPQAWLGGQRPESSLILPPRLVSSRPVKAGLPPGGRGKTLAVKMRTYP